HIFGEGLIHGRRMRGVSLADHFRAYGIAAGAQERLANNVPQLANVARPRLLLEKCNRLWSYDRTGRAQFRPVFLQKIQGQIWNVLGSLAQGRQLNERNIEAEVKVLSKLVLLNCDLQVAM